MFPLLGDESETLAPMFVFKVYFKNKVIENISLYGKSNINVLRLEQKCKSHGAMDRDHTDSKLGKSGPSKEKCYMCSHKAGL